MIESRAVHFVEDGNPDDIASRFLIEWTAPAKRRPSQTDIFNLHVPCSGSFQMENVQNFREDDKEQAFKRAFEWLVEHHGGPGLTPMKVSSTWP